MFGALTETSNFALMALFGLGAINRGGARLGLVAEHP
jgi:hypothetical protein